LNGIRRFCLLCVVVAAATRPAFGAGTQYFTYQSQSDWTNGTPKNVAIADNGNVSLAPEIKNLAETEEPYVWCVATDADGNVYAGTGLGGKVYRVTSDGKASVLVDTPELAVLSLAVGRDGALYAGTAPDGLIYRIDPKATMPTPVTVYRADGTSYIWALVFGADGTLYAATGEKARIVQLTPKDDGSYEPTTLLESDESHIVTLVLRDGILFAGSDGNGLIYRVNPAEPGKGFVIYDTEEREVHNLVADRSGNLYASAAQGQAPRPQRGGMPQPPGQDGKPETQSLLYQIAPDGVVRPIWKCPDPLILSLAVDGDRVLVGTGDEGKLYSVNARGDATYLGKVEESQALAIVANADRFLVATANSGKLYSMGAAVAKEGTWESKPADAKLVSTWGRIRWDADVPPGTTVAVKVRSGNTEKPDKTWSDWSSELTDAAGSVVPNPAARFLQVQLTLKSETEMVTPTVRKVEAAYLQVNVTPEIGAIEVGVPQDEGRGGSKLVPETRRQAQWKTEDANGDELEFALYYRSEGEAMWHLIKDELSAPTHTWDSASMPDGVYRVKVVATDKPSNPTDRAKSNELVGEPFLIDNSKPTVADIRTARLPDGSVQVLFSASDVTSPLAKASYVLDTKRSRVIYPTDGVFDAQTETFELVLTDLPENANSIAVTVADIAGNVGTARVRF
jgi:sugar lactone lactonase YvrE